MKSEMTIGEKYGPAMKITDETEAKRYLEECIAHCMSHGHSRAEAERIERSNLGYYAGYYGTETRLQVERLFDCAHPVFGKTADGVPTMAESFAAGVNAVSP